MRHIFYTEMRKEKIASHFLSGIHYRKNCVTTFITESLREKLRHNFGNVFTARGNRGSRRGRGSRRRSRGWVPACRFGRRCRRQNSGCRFWHPSW